MRIITRPDFDGIVCAVLLKDVLGIKEPIAWVEPYELGDYEKMVKESDIIANLPYVNGVFRPSGQTTLNSAGLTFSFPTTGGHRWPRSPEPPPVCWKAMRRSTRRRGVCFWKRSAKRRSASAVWSAISWT